MKLLAPLLIILLIGCSTGRKEMKEEWINFKVHEKYYHDDLEVSIPSQYFHRSFDTYYFAMKHRFPDYPKIRFSVSRLLKNWILNINELKADSIKYLPMDFSDEYIGAFKVRLANDSLKLQFGSSEDLGFGVDPENPDAYFNNAVNFTPDRDTREISVSRITFINGLNRNIENLERSVH